MTIKLTILDPITPKDIYPLIKQLNPDLEYNIFEQYLKTMISNGYFMIGAYDKEKLVGITGCWTGTRFYCGKYIEIDNFVVDEPYRGKGIGDMIMQHVIDVSRGKACDSIVLNAYVWNDDGHRFYDRYGFEIMGKHRVLKL